MIVGARVEVINPDGIHLADVTPDSAKVSCNGANTEQFSGSLGFVGPDWYPNDDTDLLSPLTGNRVRLWWREDGVETLLATLQLNNPSGTASPGVAWQIRLDDPLSRAKANGYGPNLINVGGYAVDEALLELFDVVDPSLQVAFPASSTLLPAVYVLGTGQVDTDWAALAAIDGSLVRSTREGGATTVPATRFGAPVADWQEGPDCVVVKLGRDVNTEGIRNAVRVRSSSSAVVPVVESVRMDLDESSPTYVGGPLGVRWRNITSDVIATQDAADTLAEETLAASLRPVESTKVTVPPRPDLNPGDAVVLGLADLGVAGIYQIQGWSLTLPKPGTKPAMMEVTMADRSA